ncbi:MAG: GNAT family N-acetyltransferase [Flavobacteriales bacterium]|nr:GNAT family N-acetyltransferase [Flavobacteriales bacterium]
MSEAFEFQIRRGKITDLQAVLDLIRELAIYEKCPNEVTLTIEQLEQDGFGNAPAYLLWVAEVAEEVVGLALCYPKYSTWKGRCLYLEDLVVKEEFRGKGLGGALFKEVATFSANVGMARLEWQVLDWNEPAIRFYESLHAHLDSEWVNCRLTGESLTRYASI